MTTNSQLATHKPKNTKNQNRNKITEIEITWRVISGESEGENEGKGTGNKKHKWQVETRQGEVKNSMGNGEAKELICTTHGHELSGGMQVGEGQGVEGDKGEEKMRKL